MNDIAARPAGFPWASFAYLLGVVASLAGWILYPLPWFAPPLSDILFAAGFLVLAGVVAIDVSAIRTMRNAKTTIWPHQGASHLVTTGPFSFSRHPIYLANTMAMFGIGLISGIVWFFIFGLLAAFATQKLAVEPEERHMEARFGKKYRDYAKRVRRWI
ncbi:MAG: isoprenylcysteine carboxylmethyltransferase family protein [Rhizobiaceae bacterium]|nr:isoprenylcysteine carboxylmethyltransferase family protein [Rhizobiaceae bacterium]